MKNVFYFYFLISFIHICKLTELGMETKTEIKTEMKTEGKTEMKSEMKLKTSTEMKSETKSQSKTEANSQIKSEMKTKTNSQLKTETKSEVKSQSKTEINSKLSAQSKSESTLQLLTEYSKSNENCSNTCISCQNTLYYLKINGHAECPYNMCPGLCSVLSGRWHSNTNEILNYFKEDQINICETCFRNNFCHINDCQLEKTLAQTAIHHAIDNFNFHALNPDSKIFNFINKKSKDYFIEMDFIFRNLDKMLDQLNLFERLYTQSIKMKKLYKILLRFLANKSNLPISDINLHLDIEIDDENLLKFWKDIPDHLQIYKNYYMTLKSQSIHMDETKVYLSTDIKSEGYRIKSIEDFDKKIKFSLHKAGNMTEIYKSKTERNIFTLHKLVKFIDVIVAENLSNEEKLDYLTGKIQLNDEIAFVKFLKQPKKTKAEKVLTNLNKRNQSIMSISVNGKVIHIPPEVPVREIGPQQQLGDQINISVIKEDDVKKNKEEYLQNNLKEISLSNSNGYIDNGVRATDTTKNVNNRSINNVNNPQKVNLNVLANVKDISMKSDGSIVVNKLSLNQLKKMADKMKNDQNHEILKKNDIDKIGTSKGIVLPVDKIMAPPPIAVIGTPPHTHINQVIQDGPSLPSSPERIVGQSDDTNINNSNDIVIDKPTPPSDSSDNSSSIKGSASSNEKNLDCDKDNETDSTNIAIQTDSDTFKSNGQSLSVKSSIPDNTFNTTSTQDQTAFGSSDSSCGNVEDTNLANAIDNPSEKKSETSDTSSTDGNSNTKTDPNSNSSDSNFENFKDLFFLEKSEEDIKNFLHINPESFKLSNLSQDEDFDSYFKYDDSNDNIKEMKKTSEIIEKNKIKKLSVDEIKESSKKFIKSLKENIDDIETEREIKLRKEKIKSKKNLGENKEVESNKNMDYQMSKNNKGIIQSLSNNLKDLDEEFFELKHNIITSLLK